MDIKSKKTEMQSNKEIKCHFISNTHWDREWRYSIQRTRYNLVFLMDMLLDIFEKEPEYKSFHLDSQTVPIQDYLEVRPEKAKQIEKLVSEGKLFIGPWFCLPDEFCVSGESLVRNLLLGHKIARKFGHVSKTGYSPFSWGQISQMPQLYKGFGIEAIFFYRGINSILAPRSEFLWEGADGTKIVGSRLATRPRYNVSCIIQRAVYWGLKDVEDRNAVWGEGNGLFKLVGEDCLDMDFQFAHPKFGYHSEFIKGRAIQAIKEQDADWSTPHRFWSTGHDSSCPDIRETALIKDCNNVLEGVAEVFHSNFENFQKGVVENISENWPLLKGEMRHPYTKGSSSALFGMILSARMDIKLSNFKTERQLISYAEPMAVFASMLGAPYPASFIDLSYNFLLQNHGHDSIGGCSRDVVSDDVLHRFKQSREISSCILEKAAMCIAGSINLNDYPKESMALVVFNPLASVRSEVLSLALEIPDSWKCSEIMILDSNGDEAVFQLCEKVTKSNQIVYSPNDITSVLPSSRYYIRLEAKDIPSMGYKAFKVLPLRNSRPKQPKSMLIGPQAVENDYFVLSINSNGTLTIIDKKSGNKYEQLGYFRDSGEIGNPWQRQAPANDSVYTTLNEKADVCLVRDGELETCFKVAINWRLPERRSYDERSRSISTKPYQIVNYITVRKNQPWVEILTEVNNTVEDHYLQVSFPTGIVSNKIMAQGQFDVIERTMDKPDYSLYDEIPQTEHPMNSFIDLSNGDRGLALLNEGLKGYECHNDKDNTVSLTLLRCFPLRICVTYEMTDYSHMDKGSQCLGSHKFKYGIMPHSGNWEDASVWHISERFNLSLFAAQLEPTSHGNGPQVKSFLEVSNPDIHVSAVKRNENGNGWVIRLFNPLSTVADCKVRFNKGKAAQSKKPSPVEMIQMEYSLEGECENRWNIVREVTLEELPVRELEMDSDGYVDIQIQPKKIFTIEFQ